MPSIKINTARIERDIEHADEMVELHYQQGKKWRQTASRLRSDLLRAQRINDSHAEDARATEA